MNLLGVDVGFAKDRRTTGLAWRIGDGVRVAITGTLWEQRRKDLPNVPFVLAALDAPILPEHDGCPYRDCERLFHGGAFWNRCRPGLSHREQRGLPLRLAGMQAASQFAAVVSGARLAAPLAVRPGTGIIEAFPNAFLGVLLRDGDYGYFNRAADGHKSDWMFKRVAEQGTLRVLLSKLGWTEQDTVHLFEEQAGSNGHHEKRAALVCLMTAGFAAASSAVVVGSQAHGWFWLPPWECWQDWAKIALKSQLRRCPEAVRWRGPFFH